MRDKCVTARDRIVVKVGGNRIRLQGANCTEVLLPAIRPVTCDRYRQAPLRGAWAATSLLLSIALVYEKMHAVTASTIRMHSRLTAEHRFPSFSPVKAGFDSFCTNFFEIVLCFSSGFLFDRQ